MSKKVSAGVVVLDEKGYILLGHVTNSNRFDIPKGMIDEGELAIETAERELHEETGIKIFENELEELGLFKYNKAKDLHLFLLEKEIESDKCVCMSTFTRNEEHFPEIDGYQKVHLSEVRGFLTKSLYKTLVTALKDKYPEIES